MIETFLPSHAFVHPFFPYKKEAKDNLKALYSIDDDHYQHSSTFESIFRGTNIEKTLKYSIIEISLSKIIYQRLLNISKNTPNHDDHDDDSIKKRNDLIFHTKQAFIKSSSSFTPSSIEMDMVEVLKASMMDLQIMDSIHAIVPEILFGMLMNEKISLQQLELLESSFRNSDLQWKRCQHLVLILCYCDLNMKSRLVECCNLLISSEYFKVQDFILISSQLFTMAEKSMDYELLRDSFVIMSYCNLICPIQTDKLMVVIGECLLNQFTIFGNEKDENMFLEFVSRRISTCNNGTPQLVRKFCSIHSENVTNQIRNSPSELFTNDIKCLLDKPHKTKYFEEDIQRFSSTHDSRYLYKALNSIYLTDYNDVFQLLSNKASKLAQLNNFTMNDLEYSILLYNCIHNYHVIYEKYFEQVEHALNFEIRTKSNHLNCKGYYEVVKHFILGFFSPLNKFKTRLIASDFMLTFYRQFMNTIKENLRKIAQKTSPESCLELNSDWCDEYRQNISKIRQYCFQFVNESLVDIEIGNQKLKSRLKSWENIY